MLRGCDGRYCSSWNTEVEKELYRSVGKKLEKSQRQQTSTRGGRARPRRLPTYLHVPTLPFPNQHHLSPPPTASKNIQYITCTLLYGLFATISLSPRKNGRRPTRETSHSSFMYRRYEIDHQPHSEEDVPTLPTYSRMGLADFLGLLHTG